MSPEREQVLVEVAARLADMDPGHPLRVGVDGVCGAGKSTFTRELAEVIRRTGRRVVRLDSDGFHHVRAVRKQHGDPARGYHLHAYDFTALTERVLRPLGPGGDRRCATAVHDLATDAVIEDAWTLVADDAVLLFDCTFLQGGGLRTHWDLVVWVDVAPEVARRRAVERDAAALGGVQAAEAAYDARYGAACRIYLDEQDPVTRADVVIEHDDPARPSIRRLSRQ